MTPSTKPLRGQFRSGRTASISPPSTGPCPAGTSAPTATSPTPSSTTSGRTCDGGRTRTSPPTLRFSMRCSRSTASWPSPSPPASSAPSTGSGSWKANSTASSRSWPAGRRRGGWRSCSRCTMPGSCEFAGPDFRVEIDGDGFVGSSPAVPGGGVRARALIDAFLPRPDVRADHRPGHPQPARRRRARRRAARRPGRSAAAGRAAAGRSRDAARSAADRSVHPRRFLLGPSVSGSAGSAGFSRPGFNGAGFRQNDAVARQILRPAAGTRQPSADHSRSRNRPKELHHAR